MGSLYMLREFKVTYALPRLTSNASDLLKSNVSTPPSNPYVFREGLKLPTKS